ncbi:hypothetical protein ACCO45_004411 [Purpureocillium lilacinum]|uniref:Uncharacterized protein n=1 Tax=Purpureocillium lilacinum TaxID=33203 RepID=A0ACC4E5U0_PURLI
MPSQDGGELDEEKQCGVTALLIRETLSHVSGVPEDAIKPSSTIYHLGLDSISAIKVSVLLRKKGVTLRPRDLVTASSIRELANMATTAEEVVAEAAQPSGTWVPPSDVDVDGLIVECGISASDVEIILPATPLQVYMLTAWSKSGGSIFYPEFCYRIEGVVEEADVYRAWDRLVATTPILRTRLIATGSKDLPFVQVVASADAVQSKRVTQPLVRICVAKDQSDGAITFRLTIHHALYDGVSLPALVAQLAGLLNEGEATAAEADNAPWASFAVRPMTASSRDARREFWTEYLRGASPDVAPRPVVSSISDRTAFFDGAAIADSSELQLLAAQHGIGLQALFLAAYARSIAGPSTSSILFGVYLANRSGEADAPSTLFPTLNLVPLKVVGLSPDVDLVAVAKTIQQDIHAVSSHGRADVGLWEIYEWTGVTVDAFINFLSLPDEGPSSSTKNITVTPVKDGHVTGGSSDSSALLGEPWLQRNAVADAYPISIDVEAALQANGGLAIGVFGPREILSEDRARAMAGSVATLLRGAAAEAQ